MHVSTVLGVPHSLEDDPKAGGSAGCSSCSSSHHRALVWISHTDSMYIVERPAVCPRVPLGTGRLQEKAGRSPPGMLTLARGICHLTLHFAYKVVSARGKDHLPVLP